MKVRYVEAEDTQKWKEAVWERERDNATSLVLEMAEEVWRQGMQSASGQGGDAMEWLLPYSLQKNFRPDHTLILTQ